MLIDAEVRSFTHTNPEHFGQLPVGSMLQKTSQVYMTIHLSYVNMIRFWQLLVDFILRPVQQTGAAHYPLVFTNSLFA